MVHWIQAREAFVTGRRSVRFYTLEEPRFLLDKAWVWLDRFWLRAPRDASEAHRRDQFPAPDYDNYWYVPEAERLADVLQRTDLTRRDGKPVVIGNERKGLLAFAVGPAELPKRTVIQAGAWDLEHHVMAAAADDQPKWWVFEGFVTDPYHGSTDAKAWAAKWKAQVEAGEKPSWN